MVITIIILIILSGVTISTISGENKLISQAKKAKNEIEKATIYESDILENLFNECNSIISKPNILDILFGEPQWENGYASVEIRTTSGYEIEYQVNNEDSYKIDNGDKIFNLNHGDKIVARLINNGNILEEKEFEVKDAIPPEFKELIAKKEELGLTNHVSVNFDFVDYQSGLADTAEIIVCDKNDASTIMSNTISLSNIELPDTINFLNVPPDKEVIVKMKISDKAGNNVEKTVEVE